MAYAWFICPYNTRTSPITGRIMRYCMMDDFTSQIVADNGWWSETEVLGNAALVKVRAGDALLNTIASTTGIVRVLDRWVLTETLSGLTQIQYNFMRNKLLDMGYTDGEIDSTMGSGRLAWQQKTFGDLLSMVAKKRLKPRYDPGSNTIIIDGPEQPVKPVSVVDGEVT